MRQINQRELEDKINDIRDLTLINTLAPEKFDQTMIRGAINVPQQLDDFVERVSLVVTHNKEADIVLYGADDDCSPLATAVEKLETAGFRNVYAYPGGHRDWVQNDQASKT